VRFDLDGQIARVTGAGRGIGHDLALALAAAGARAFAGIRRRGEAPGGLEAVELDLRDVESIRAAIDEVRPTILVNNAGVGTNHDALEATEDEWDELLDVNLKGLFFACQSAGRHMVGRGYGRVVNISSQAGHVGIRRNAAYCASKGGVEALTRVLALEWGPSGVTVNAVAPGFIRTPVNAEALDRRVRRRGDRPHSGGACRSDDRCRRRRPVPRLARRFVRERRQRPRGRWLDGAMTTSMQPRLQRLNRGRIQPYDGDARCSPPAGPDLMDTARRGNYESGSDYVLEYGELRFTFNERDFTERVEQAAAKLGFVVGPLEHDEREDLVNLAVNGEVTEPHSQLGEHINERWSDLNGPSERSLVHWIRRLVFRGAWLDQRVMEGELELVFDEQKRSFGYAQPDRNSELIELSPEPSWRRVAYKR
jgi:NAD(P)-dependent dehydrogenase (short-subunit alcohol dehydrogenase family)